MEGLADALEVSVPVLAAIGVVWLAQLALQVWALVDLARRRRVAMDNKWVWLAIIVLGGFLGTVAYLAVGRRVEAVSYERSPGTDGRSAASTARTKAESAADVLYGNHEDPS